LHIEAAATLFHVQLQDRQQQAVCRLYWSDNALRSHACSLILNMQVIRVLVVFGVGAIIGDGVLTPAISVISSIEGLHQVATIGQGTSPSWMQ